VANIFRTLLSKFYQNRVKFYTGYDKNGLLFLGHGVLSYVASIYGLWNSAASIWGLLMKPNTL